MEAQRDVARKDVDDEDWVVARSGSDPSLMAKDRSGLIDGVDVTEIGDQSSFGVLGPKKCLSARWAPVPRWQSRCTLPNKACKSISAIKGS